MALQRNLNILSKGIERIDVRNLLPPPGIDIDRFNPSIEVLAGKKLHQIVGNF